MLTKYADNTPLYLVLACGLTTYFPYPLIQTLSSFSILQSLDKYFEFAKCPPKPSFTWNVYFFKP